MSVKFLLRCNMSDQPVEPEQGRAAIISTSYGSVGRWSHCTAPQLQPLAGRAGPCAQLGLQEPQFCWWHTSVCKDWQGDSMSLVSAAV